MLDFKELNLTAALVRVEAAIKSAAAQGKLFTWIRLGQNIDKKQVRDHLLKMGLSCSVAHNAIYVGWAIERNEYPCYGPLNPQ